MTENRNFKDRQENKTGHSPYPPYSSLTKYDYDPFCSAESIVDYEEPSDDNRRKESAAEVKDEPVESWGWVQNTD